MFSYQAELGGGLTLVNTRHEHADQLQELQDMVFPTLAPEERFRAVHYRKHVDLFPEGQFVVLSGEKVVGMTSTIRLHFDFEHQDHTFADVIQGGFLTSHEPDGPWLYGADIGTHPSYRRLGIARALYEARHAVVRHFGLAGQVTVGMMSGYGARKSEITPEQYYQGLLDGTVKDPTVSAQVRLGFEMRGLLRGYLNDPVCDNCGILLVLDASRPVG
jgi:GNAT superfamily N-acetyltransferase